ncbi:MAG: hypothetical protein JST67_06270 [Bacteroidetes bacterium]|nr:hypothetical protein [Bacteroidota bacterium]
MKFSYSTQVWLLSIVLLAGSCIGAVKGGVHIAYAIALAVFFTGFSFVLHAQLEQALKSENKNQFTYSFLMFTGLKMFACLILLLIGLYFTPSESRMPLGIGTMMYYLIFTAFEVRFWLKRLK